MRRGVIGSQSHEHCRASSGWHKASVSDCLPLAAPIGLSPLLILTLYGSEGVLVVSTEPLDDLSCLTTAGLAVPETGCSRAVDQVHPDAHSKSMLGLPTPTLTCARWDVGRGVDRALRPDPPPPPKRAQLT